MIGGVENCLPMEDDGSGACEDMNTFGQSVRDAIRMISVLPDYNAVNC